MYVKGMVEEWKFSVVRHLVLSYLYESVFTFSFFLSSLSIFFPFLSLLCFQKQGITDEVFNIQNS